MGLQVYAKCVVSCYGVMRCTVVYCHTMCLCRVVPNRTVYRFVSVCF